MGGQGLRPLGAHRAQAVKNIQEVLRLIVRKSPGGPNIHIQNVSGPHVQVGVGVRGGWAGWQGDGVFLESTECNI